MTPEDLVLTPRGIRFRGRLVPVSIGRGGVRSNKREGDGATPRGTHILTGLFYRPDRLAPPALVFVALVVLPLDDQLDLVDGALGPQNLRRLPELLAAAVEPAPAAPAGYFDDARLGLEAYADAVAKQVGLDEARGDLMPDDKVTEIKKLLQKPRRSAKRS